MVTSLIDVEPLLLTAEQASECLALSESSLYRATRRGELPRVKLGRLVRYDLADLKAWIDRKTAILAN